MRWKGMNAPMEGFTTGGGHPGLSIEAQRLQLLFDLPLSLLKRHLTRHLLCSFSQPTNLLTVPFETPVPMAFGDKVP